MTTTVMTLVGAVGRTSNYMSDICQGFAHTGDRVEQKIDYPASVFDGSSIGDGVAALDAALLASQGTVIVLGHSMGSQVASEWLRTMGATRASLASRVSFILLANPCRRYGHPWWPVNNITAKTPDTTAFVVHDVARWGDGWCNAPLADNIFNPQWWDLGKIATAIVGMLTVHTLYDLDLTNLPGIAQAAQAVGNTTYYVTD